VLLLRLLRDELRDVCVWCLGVRAAREDERFYLDVTGLRPRKTNQ
jgi:hypothetical protein